VACRRLPFYAPFFDSGGEKYEFGEFGRKTENTGDLERKTHFYPKKNTDKYV
jgi:hypothetical protein